MKPGRRGQIISLCLILLLLCEEGDEGGRIHEETLQGSTPVPVCLSACLSEPCLALPVVPFLLLSPYLSVRYCVSYRLSTCPSDTVSLTVSIPICLILCLSFSASLSLYLLLLLLSLYLSFFPVSLYICYIVKSCFQA